MIWSSYARPDEGRELPPSKSSYLDDEARIIRRVKIMEAFTQAELEEMVRFYRAPFQEAARRELKRRELFGVKG